MPAVTVYRSHRTIARESPRPYAVGWDEYSWAPAGSGHRVSPAGWTHRLSDPEPIRVRVPPGPIRPADAEAVYQLAAAGEQGFRLEGDEVAKRRDDGPTLFGPEPDPTASAYPRPAPPPAQADRAALRPVVAELAREVIEPELARARAYAELMATGRNTLIVAAARAIGCIAEGQYQTARAILEEAKERAESAA
jgi:hypothetical protein